MTGVEVEVRASSSLHDSWGRARALLDLVSKMSVNMEWKDGVRRQSERERARRVCGQCNLADVVTRPLGLSASARLASAWPGRKLICVDSALWRPWSSESTVRGRWRAGRSRAYEESRGLRGRLVDKVSIAKDVMLGVTSTDLHTTQTSLLDPGPMIAEARRRAQTDASVDVTCGTGELVSLTETVTRMVSRATTVDEGSTSPVLGVSSSHISTGSHRDVDNTLTTTPPSIA